MQVTVLFHRLAAREYRKARNWYVERSEMVAAKWSRSVSGMQLVEPWTASLPKATHSRY